MSEAKYTKGPWRVGVPIAGKINISHLDCTPGAITQNLCWVAARPSWHEEGKANARLIASAPDMLSALERLTHSYRLLLAGKPVRDVEETLAEVDAAISKATEAA